MPRTRRPSRPSPALKLRWRKSFRLTIGSRSVSSQIRKTASARTAVIARITILVGVEPVLVVAQIQQHLQRSDAHDQRGQADVIHLRRLQPFRASLQLCADHGAGEDADRNVDEEDPFPAVVVGDPPAEDRACDGRDDGHHRQQGDRLSALVRWIDRDQQRLRDRIHRPADEPLQCARDDEQAHAVGDAAQERRDHERERRPHEQLALAEATRHVAGQRQRDRVADRERGDHPRRLVGAGAEVA